LAENILLNPGASIRFLDTVVFEEKIILLLKYNFPAKPILANVPDDHFDPPTCQFNTSCALFNSSEQLRKAVSRFLDSVPESHFQAPVLRHKLGFLDFAYKVVSAVAPKIVDLFSVHTDSEVRKQLFSD